MRRMFSENQIKELASNEAKLVQKDITTLVDKDGHPRFIEGDVVIRETSGLEQTYGKWSLSGTHLMIVFAGDIEQDAVLPYDGAFVTIDDLPSWVLDKIVPQSSYSGTYIDRKDVPLLADDATSQNGAFILRKSTTLFVTFGGVTATKDRSFRVAFDLLIDNE